MFGRYSRRSADRRIALGIVAAAFASLIVTSCERATDDPAPKVAKPALQISPETASRLRTLSPVPPLPADPTNRFADLPDAAHFGQFLFFDPALSSNGNLSCATCHRPGKMFTDGLQVAQAAGTGSRNAPSVVNAAYFPWLNWDGSADTLWSQAARPFEAEHELATTRGTVAKLIGTNSERRTAYETVFGDLPPAEFFRDLPDRARPMPESPGHPDHLAWQSLTDRERAITNDIFINLCKAIAAYQRRLIAVDSPFDRFTVAVAADELDRWAESGNPGFGEAEARGLDLFIGEAGCIACHAGPLFTDFTFHSVRVAPTGGGAPTDPGRFDGLRGLKASEFNSAGPFSDAPDSPIATRLRYMTSNSESWGLFRTPSLRNVTLTAPYMHAGQFEDLDRVLEHYSTFHGALPPDHHAIQQQLLRPLNLTDEQKSDLLAFLASLTDTSLPPHLLEPPASPVPRQGEAKTGL